jgi:hypothetical protein
LGGISHSQTTRRRNLMQKARATSGRLTSKVGRTSAHTRILEVAPSRLLKLTTWENYFSRLPRLKGFLDLRSYGQMRTCISIEFAHDIVADGRIVRSVHAFFLFVQENSKGRRGSVGSHLWGCSCDKEITWHAVHRRPHAISCLFACWLITLDISDGSVVFDTI